MFDGYSIESLAISYKYECITNAGTVDARLNLCQEKLAEMAGFITTIDSIISSLGVSKSTADTTAELFNNGAYKDGITNFAGDLNTMSTNVENTITSLNTMRENVVTYITALAEYMDNLSTLSTLWNDAYQYYLNHKEEIEVL